MKALRIFLQTIGALTLVAILLAALWLSLFSPFVEKSTLNKSDAIFIFNWAGINNNQDWKIIESSASARNITGDHADFYCIQLEHFNVDEKSLQEEWRQGPEENALLAKAVESGAMWARHEGSGCFPPPEVANSSRMQIMFWSVTTHGRRPSAAKIILFESESKQLFYVSYKT